MRTDAFWPRGWWITQPAQLQQRQRALTRAGAAARSRTYSGYCNAPIASRRWGDTIARLGDRAALHNLHSLCLANVAAGRYSTHTQRTQAKTHLFQPRRTCVSATAGSGAGGLPNLQRQRALEQAQQHAAKHCTYRGITAPTFSRLGALAAQWDPPAAFCVTPTPPGCCGRCGAPQRARFGTGVDP